MTTDTVDNEAAIGLGCHVHLRRDADGRWGQVRFVATDGPRGICVPRPVETLRHLDALESGAADAWIDRDVNDGKEMPSIICRLLIVDDGADL